MRSMFAHVPQPAFVTLAFTCLVAMALTGCGSDDDGPTNPNGIPSTTEFTEVLAMSQASTSALEAVTLVGSMSGLSAGLDKAAALDFEYGWNLDRHRWESHSQTSGGGATADYLYWVQYLDSTGNPQESVVGAVKIVHGLTGTSTYHFETEDRVQDQEWEYEYLVEIVGLGGATLTMTGDGGNDWDTSGQANGVSFAYHYEVDWEILAPGITRPAAGGCPTGTVRFNMAPYYSLVVFDGTSVAVSTLYDANGDAVDGGQSSHQVYCDR